MNAVVVLSYFGGLIPVFGGLIPVHARMTITGAVDVPVWHRAILALDRV